MGKVRNDRTNKMLKAMDSQALKLSMSESARELVYQYKYSLSLYFSSSATLLGEIGVGYDDSHKYLYNAFEVFNHALLEEKYEFTKAREARLIAIAISPTWLFKNSGCFIVTDNFGESEGDTEWHSYSLECNEEEVKNGDFGFITVGIDDIGLAGILIEDMPNVKNDLTFKELKSIAGNLHRIADFKKRNLDKEVLRSVSED